MGRTDYRQASESSTRRLVGTAGRRQRACVVLGWVTFEPDLQLQLVEAEELVHRLPREAEASAMLRLAFLARDRELLDLALETARRAAAKRHC